MNRTLSLLAALLLAACVSEPPGSPPTVDDPDPADPSTWDGTLSEPTDPAGDDDDVTPEEPTPSPEEIGLSPGDSDPGVPGVMTGLYARVAWNDGFVQTPPQEITLTAPSPEGPAPMPEQLPGFEGVTPQQTERVGHVQSVLQSRMQLSAGPTR